MIIIINIIYGKINKKIHNYHLVLEQQLVSL